MANLAVDTFIRGDQSGFGTASDGSNTWGSPINSGNSTAAIASNEGTITATGASTDDSQIICGTHSGTTDINILIRTKTNNSGNLNGVLWRYTSGSGGNGYRAGFYGGTSFNVDKYTNGSRSNITSASVSGGYNTGDFWWIRLIHTAGNTLSIRWWKDGNSEPSDFTGYISQSETSFTSGNFGVSAFYNGTGAAASYDTMTVTDNQSAVTHMRISDGYGGVFS